ncbi:MAG TPA: PAS domain S-box protein [Pyrinomonadaceae bacterium]|nr:PAS domain S-box protein [Pyrinomonadaceae bacterium]
MAESPESTALPPSSSRSLDIILSSIGDGVIATDADARITYLNPVAEALTGWSVKEAQGTPLETVFQIVNEDTRSPVENPAVRALREGVIFGLANHTLLINRHGKEIPIDDSGSPIKDESGALVGAVLVFREITERRKAEREHGLLAAIVQSAEDAIISKNLDGVIESWNAGAERLFEYCADEVIGRSVKIIIPPDRHAEEEQILTRLRRGERIEHFETVRVSKSGRLLDIDLTVSPVRHETEIVGASKIARDISTRKRLEEERQQLLAREQSARERAETASVAKDEFIAQVSHEMRTPLNSILGWTGILRTHDYDRDRTMRATDTIERNTKVQLQLIEDLIDLSKIVKGKMHLQLLPLQITDLLTQAIETVRPAAEAKSITIQEQTETSAGLIVGDPDRLLQVLWNLLSNAVKFTPKGGKIQLQLRRLAGHVELSVKDSGVGIDRAFLPFVFDRFSQAVADTRDRRQSGLGLGLALVRYFVELHGGAVTAESEGEGKGATFTITLPTKKH